MSTTITIRQSPRYELDKLLGEIVEQVVAWHRLSGEDITRLEVVISETAPERAAEIGSTCGKYGLEFEGWDRATVGDEVILTFSIGYTGDLPF